jgi:hypothetical protein
MPPGGRERVGKRPSSRFQRRNMKITYKIVSVADGTFEVFKQLNGRSVRTMGNYKSKGDAERVKKGLETGAIIRIEPSDEERGMKDSKGVSS